MNSSGIYQDCFNITDILSLYKVTNLYTFTEYLVNIWRDLSQRNKEEEKGISRLTFTKYYELNGIISDRLFCVFDTNEDNYLDVKEFVSGMTNLFSGYYDQLLKLIFYIYDFDKDGKIKLNDVKLILEYVPIRSNQPKKSSSLLKYENAKFRDRIEVQKELSEILKSIFGENEQLNFTDFKNVIKEKNSDIFLFLLLFIFEKRPFNNDTLSIIEAYDMVNFDNLKRSSSQQFITTLHFVAQPSLRSKILPKTFKMKIDKRSKSFIPEENSDEEKQSFGDNFKNFQEDKKTINKEEKAINDNNNIVLFSDNNSENDINSTIIPKRKAGQFINFENSENNDNNIFPGIKKEKTDLMDEKSFDDNSSADCDDIKKINYEGYIYKITKSNKRKKLYFKLIFRDLFYFEDKYSKVFIGFHHIGDSFIKINQTIKFENQKYYSFSLIYPHMTRNYLVKKKKNWISKIKNK